ncbi:MAG TPA: VanW family protein [Fimbriimonadaceae bacterium]|nr:VanW family protein [Fimbriimonadaceae bacterium]
MKKVLIVALSVLAAIGALAAIVAARFEPTIVRNTYVGIVNVGGLTKEEAAKKVRIWWETQRVKKLELKNNLLRQPLSPMTPGMLGVTVDDEGSVADLPMSDLMEAVTEKVGASAPEQQKFPVKFKAIQVPLDDLKKAIRASVGKDRPARVVYKDGAIVRQPEVSGLELDDKLLADAVIAGIPSGSVQLPLQEAPKALPDEELDKITDVVSEFSTSFPSYQTSRNTNIRLAAAKLNGCVLLPGQQLSFNDTVGRRTAKGGFREAPVLKNGKHDHDIGGGICQVSTTLYNAALLADMKIVRRNNHSLPSAYVALGRDATVDWGNLDLVIENSSDKPVAVASNYKDGRITFRILGQKDPSISIKIETANHSAWDRGTEMVIDKSLKPGTRTVVEKGSRGHSIDTYRIIYKDGVEIRREHLSHSTYAGCPRTIAYNPAPAAPKPGIQPPGSLPPGTSQPPVTIGHS